jgi:diacylglycerol kinase family enzyme
MVFVLDNAQSRDTSADAITAELAEIRESADTIEELTQPSAAAISARRRKLLVLRNVGARMASDDVGQCGFGQDLRDAGFEVSERDVEGARDFESIIGEMAGSHDAVVVGGGDGSIRAAVAPALGADIPMCVWPLGTANDFARSLGIETKEDCIAALQRWSERRVDVAQANGLYFLNNASVGLPAEAASLLTREAKRRFGIFATIAVMPRLWGSARIMELTIETDDRAIGCRSIAVLAGNGRCEGGFPVRYLGLADGRLHLLICRARTRWAIVPILVDVALRRVPASGRIEQASVQRAVIRTLRPRRVALDGDVLTQTPVTIQMHHAALRVLV